MILSVDRGTRPHVALVLLVLLQLTVFGVDAADQGVALTPLMILPVVAIALLHGPRVTLAFGLFTLLLSFLLGAFNDTFLTAQHDVRMAGVAGAAIAATLVSAGRRRLEEDIARLELLAALAEGPAGPRGVAETAAAMTDAIVPAFGDHARVTLRLPDGPPVVVERAYGLGRIDRRSAMVLPLRVPGREFGTLELSRGGVRATFGLGDERFGMALAARMALSLENARLVDELLRAEAQQREVALALQHSLRPPALPKIPGLRLASYYRAVGEGAEVGGDFYDAHDVGDGWMLVIGDVTGKGAGAAALTAFARGALEAAGAQTRSCVHAVARLDELLRRRDELSLCSVACVHLRPAPDGLDAEVVLAGHPPVLLLRGGEVQAVGRPGPLPGAFPGAHWAAERVTLHPGDAIVLRTDGVTDTVGADGRLGEDRLRAAVAGAPHGDADSVVRRIRGLVDAHTVGPQRDDTAVLVAALDEAVVPVPVVPAVEPPLVLDLDADPASVAAARRAVERRFGTDLRADALADVRLLVSELVTNAVRHGAGGTARLVLDGDDRHVRAEIVDPGRGFTPPVRTDTPATADGLTEGGYGLGLVERLASRWGIDDEGGTRVWFELDVR